MIDTEEIKKRISIVDFISGYLKLTKAGTNYKALCPFHKEKTPSFVVNPEKGIWHCFGCGKGGDHFTFYMEIENASFSEALKFLAEKAGVSLKNQDYNTYLKNGKDIKYDRDKIYKINKIVTNLYNIILLKKEGAKKVKEYLKNRGLNEKTINEYEIGYAPERWDFLLSFLKKKKIGIEDLKKTGLFVLKDNNSLYDRFRGRIMFPFKDLQGRYLGFSGRIYDNEDANKKVKKAKYVNTSNTLIYNKSQYLYNLDKAREAIRLQDRVLILEGQMDVIISTQAGIKEVVAPCGTALTKDHLRILKRYTNNILLCFDGDEAGINATKKSLKIVIEEGLNAKVVSLEIGKDPAEIALENKEKWFEVVNNNVDFLDYYLKFVLNNNDKNTIEGKKEITKEMRSLIMGIKNPIEKMARLESLAEIVGIDENVLLSFYKNKEENNSKILKEVFSNKKIYLKNKEEFLFQKLLSIFLKYPSEKFYYKELKKIKYLPEKNKELLNYILGEIVSINESDINRYEREKIYIESLSIELNINENKVLEEFKKLYKQLQGCLNNNYKEELKNKIKIVEKNNNNKEVEALLEELSTI